MLFKRKKPKLNEWQTRFAFPLPVCVAHDLSTGTETFVWFDWYETRLCAKDHKRRREFRLPNSHTEPHSIPVGNQTTP